MTIKWIDWVKQIQSIAQAGLTYSKDVYDIERFQQLRDISISMMSHYTKTDWEVVEKLFASETGYQTPKVDIRAVVFQNEKLLFVKEKSDGKWALPGGWADVGYTPSEVAAKEVFEEAGYEVDHFKLLAIFDKEKINHLHRQRMYIRFSLDARLLVEKRKLVLKQKRWSFLVKMNCLIYQLLEIQKTKLKRCLPT